MLKCVRLAANWVLTEIVVRMAVKAGVLKKTKTKF